MGPLAWKVIGSGAAVLAGLVANKIATTAWRTAGKDDQIDPNDPDVPLGQALAFAALVGLAVGTAKVLATRQAAEYYRRTAGTLPPEFTKD
ncbi:MAG: DUF4235 domain-containing protein [Actinomycetia bacterium]|nr:DUF4235 domain-containing protein [Actinomycetes bacterium]